MPSTNTLERTIALARSFCGLRLLTSIGGATNEPAFSNGDWVRQFLLSPPFAWRWNRATTTISLVAGQQDYPVNLTDFGWLEKGSITYTANNQTITKELLVDNNLSVSSAQELPVHVSAYFDDDNNDITFRFLPIPYPTLIPAIATIIYQKRAPMFQTISDSWAPIPDYLSYLVNQGFIAKSYEFINDERWGPALQLFIRQVVAANNGLSDTQVNIFLSERINTARQQAAELGAQGGRPGRY